ncbi:MAG: PP2C family protein-serine/threonine phosphatase [Planctomycetaceae bacterium]
MMRVLVKWDDPEEAELISLYLNVDGDEAVITSSGVDEFFHEAERGGSWQAVLMPISSPDHETAYETFLKVASLLPDVPVVGACQEGDSFRIARFLTHGLRSYVLRDAAGDFMFLLKTTLESTVEAVRAERERLISERLREEVESVRKLQASIMPATLTSPDGYGICGRYESSQIRVLGGQPVVLAGGDYYDVFRLDEHTTVVLVGDASGHGMKACMSIMTMHTLVSMLHGHDYLNPAKFVAEVNQRLCRQTIVQDEGGFITLLYGLLRSDTHEFHWTSAGHPLPILYDGDAGTVRPLGGLDDGGLPLGIVPDAEYDMHVSPVPPGGRLLVYTDGLQEAFSDGSPDHKEYGLDGIERTLRESVRRSLEDTLQALFDDSSSFTQGTGRHDDTSVVLVERVR